MDILEKAKKHEQETTQIFEYLKKSVDDKLLKKAGVSRKVFENKLKVLCDKWAGKSNPLGDCDGTRFAKKILYGQLEKSIVIIIMGDNLKYFKDYKESEKDDFYCNWIEWACMCGAKDIVSHIFDQIADQSECKTTIINSKFIVPFALSSKDDKFALNVAEQVKKLGQKEQSIGLMYFYGIPPAKMSTIQQIENSFVNQSHQKK